MINIESVCQVDTTQCKDFILQKSVFHSTCVTALKAAGDSRPAGGALCGSRADGQRVGQGEAARHCDEHSVQKGLHW